MTFLTVFYLVLFGHYGAITVVPQPYGNADACTAAGSAALKASNGYIQATECVEH